MKLFLGLIILILMFVQYTVPSAKAQTDEPQDTCADDWLQRVIRFSPDGNTLFSGWDLETAKFWDIATGTELHRIFTGKVTDAQFSPDGKYILTGNSNGESILWNADTGTKVNTYFQNVEPSLAHLNMIKTVGFLPDGKTVFTSTILSGYLWDIDTGKKLKEFHTDTGDIETIKLSPNGNFLLIDGVGVRIWNIDTEKEVATFDDSRGNFSPDGKYIVTYTDKNTTLWDANSFNKLQSFDGESPRFSPSGRLLTTLVGQETLLLWDFATGQKLYTFQHAFFPFISFVSNDESIIILSANNYPPRTMEVWDTISFTKQSEFNLEENVITYPTVSPDGSYVALGLENGLILIWNLKENRKLYEYCS